MKHLVIIGAGGFGREMFAAATNARGYMESFDVKGFLDENPRALDGFADYPEIIGAPSTYAPQEGDVFITALGNIASRRKCAAIIAEKGGEFISIVAKTAFIGTNVRIGKGSFIANNATLTADITIGDHACVFHSSSVGHDSVLGDFSHVYAQCSIGGAVRVGEGARIFPGAVVVPRRRIGRDSTVGAGSTVLIDVEDGKTVFGSPAMEIA
ncbi:MAG: acetyltransferase [Kiritimatiellae bacterium]|nr:acetyltransferase [Kiritimatiellia bacterium]